MHAQWPLFGRLRAIRRGSPVQRQPTGVYVTSCVLVHGEIASGCEGGLRLKTCCPCRELCRPHLLIRHLRKLILILALDVSRQFCRDVACSVCVPMNIDRATITLVCQRRASCERIKGQYSRTVQVYAIDTHVSFRHILSVVAGT